VITLKSPGEIALMREAGRLVARTLTAVREHAAVGVRLDELDTLAHDLITGAGARPSFLHYQPTGLPTPYPGTLCLSVNDAVVHGIPSRYALREGDLLSVDAGAHLAGWCGDSAISFVVGDSPDPSDLALIDTAEAALAAGIAAARPGARLGDVEAAIGAVARPAGYGLLAHYGGHGVGRDMHEGPSVANEGRPGRGLRLRPGLVLALEPMLIAGGGDEYTTDEDGWTLRTADGSRAAHVEHTVAVTADGPLVLTAP